MIVSIEISYYPLTENYAQAILEFVNRLHKHSEIAIKTNGMSTQVFGEYKYAMNCITAEIEKSFEIPNSVFVLKIINHNLNQ